ncbi:hypothetical protein [Marinilabilia rubra]|uniref:Uncharacterized protein n=1 Tax=Marinilabilia rubra TaxID=2162893 RepID=A0A2U2B7G4_9BACT|nr:hypothetical protein [Marinilabilia rubra]PWD99021.1 hypothetical protein DDZ16_12205 [Marinilabilia rubra]
MRLDRFIILITFPLFSCQCSFFNTDRPTDHKKIEIKCLSNGCQINNESVIIVLNKKDCQRCTEKVERLAEIISEKITKKRIVFIIKNYDKNTLAAYKRSLSGISNQILEDNGEVTMHSNIKGMSHFIVFEESTAKYKTFLPDQFNEMSNLLNY